MIKHIFLIASIIVVVGLSLLLLALPSPDTSASNSTKASSSNAQASAKAAVTNSFLIKNVSLFDGQQVLTNKSVSVKDGIISLIADTIDDKGFEVVVNGNGKTLLPGLIDSHTHTYGSGLVDALRFGVTAHFDMFSMETTLQASRGKRDSLELTKETDLYSSGTMATVDGGHGTQYGFTIDTIDSIEEVASWVSLRKQAGVDYIKLVYMPYQRYMPSLDRATAQEVIKQAHKHGLKALAHISKQAAAKDMIEDGIDGLVHIFADTLATEEIIALAKQKNVFIIPTLAVIASVDSRGLAQALASREELKPLLSAQQQSSLLANFGDDIPGYNFDNAKQNVKRFFDAGVPILAGSDAPNSGTAFGVSLHHEIMLLVESGLNEQEAIMAATIIPADIFDVSRGRIGAGDRADLLLINGNPFKDINTLLNIDSVFKNGYRVDTSLANANGQNKTLETLVLSQFEQESLKTIDEFIWSGSDDSMANGQSQASISLSLDDEKQSTVLLVKATVDATFPYPWAGAAVGDFMPPINGYDISNNSKLSLEIKGTPGTYRIMSFDAAAAGIPPTQTIEVTEQWQTITVSLNDFPGFNPQAFSGFAIVAGPKVGEYEFTLDKVRIE